MGADNNAVMLRDWNRHSVCAVAISRPNVRVRYTDEAPEEAQAAAPDCCRSFVVVRLLDDAA